MVWIVAVWAGARLRCRLRVPRARGDPGERHGSKHWPTRARRRSTAGCCPRVSTRLAVDGEIVAGETLGDAAARQPLRDLLGHQGGGRLDVLDADPGRRRRHHAARRRTTSPSSWPTATPTTVRAITVEQVMLHTSGFPHAPLGPPAVAHPRGPPRAHAVVADATGSRARGSNTTRRRPTGCWPRSSRRVAGTDYRTVVADRVLGPLGLDRVRSSGCPQASRATSTS